MSEPRDWDATWERWKDMTPEERAAVSAEIHAAFVAANEAFRVAAEGAAKAIRAFGEAWTAANREIIDASRDR